MTTANEKRMNAEQIMKDNDLMGLAERGEHKAVIDILRKYPEQRGEILVAMLREVTSERPRTGGVKEARIEMLHKVGEIVQVIGAFNEAFNMMGISPMINDERSYGGVPEDINKTMVAEDMKAGLDLYNVCAEYCRIYNANKDEAERDKSKEN